MRKSKAGFTLIELMIVVAIISILAAIAIPNFVNQTLRAKQAEAFALLGAIKNGQVTYMGENDCFIDISPNPPGPAGPLKRSWTNVPAVPPNACTGPLEFANLDILPVNGQSYFTYDCRANGVLADFEFACTAVGDLDGNGNPSEFIVCGETGSDGVALVGSTGAPCTFEGEIFRVSQARY